MYELFHDGEEPPKLPNLPSRKNGNAGEWGSKGRNARWLAKFRKLLSRMHESDRMLLMFMAQKMARAKAV